MLSCSVPFFGEMLTEDNLFNGIIPGKMSHADVF